MNKYIKFIIVGFVIAVVHTLILGDSESSWHDFWHFISTVLIIWGILGDAISAGEIVIRPKSVNLNLSITNSEGEKIRADVKAKQAKGEK